MEESKKGSQSMGEDPKKSFISKEDRPEVQITLDTPVSELRVRELSTILRSMVGKNPNFENKTHMKDFFDKPFPEQNKDKEWKDKEVEKPPKEKNEKIEKNEKHEKSEIKEFKAEKIENDGIFETPRDPQVTKMVEAIAGLTKQVENLSDQVEELKKKG